MSAVDRLRDLADGPDAGVEHGLRRDIREVLTKLEEADLERAKLLVERDIRKGRRLLDGTPTAVGQRVVIDRAAYTRAGLAHGWDDKVHEITSLLHCEYGLVDCGPSQINAGHLRVAPAGAEVSCESCAGWHVQMAKYRVDAEAYRSRQVDAFADAARKFVARSKWDEFDTEWTRMLHPDKPLATAATATTPADAGWCFAPDADAETWTGADSREDAIARGKLDYEGAPFVIAPGRRIAARDLAVPNGENLWEQLTGDDMDVGEEGMGRLVAAATEEEVDDLGSRVRAVVETWLEPIAARCGWWMVDADKAEEITP